MLHCGGARRYSATVVTPSRPWILLSYQMPREPSTPRISVWRKMKRLGVAHLADGLVALPMDPRTREHLEWIADEVVDGGGSASLWIAAPASIRDEQSIVDAMTTTVAGQYEAVATEADAAREAPDPARRRILARLRRELRRIRQRDYFPSVARDRAVRAVERLAAVLESA